MKEEEEEEFVLLDLDGVCMPCDITPNLPYVLSVSYMFNLHRLTLLSLLMTFIFQVFCNFNAWCH